MRRRDFFPNHVLTSGLFLMLAVAVASPATAERAPGDEAQAHFERGVELYQAGDNAAALVELNRSYELRPRPEVLLNIARCHADLGRFGEAVTILERYLREGGDAIPARTRQEVEAEVQRLGTLVGRIEIRTDVPGATISIDGREIGTSPLTGAVAARSGRRVVEARLDGHQSARQDVSVGAGEQQTIELSLPPVSRGVALRVEGDLPGATVFVDGVERGPAPWAGTLDEGEHEVELLADGYEPARQNVMLTAGEPQIIDLAPLAARAGDSSRRRLSQGWFWSMAAVALLAAGAATATGILALQSDGDLTRLLDDIESGEVTGQTADLENRRQELADETDGFALVTDIMIGVAGAAAVTAIVLAFFTRFSSDEADTGFLFSPALASSGGMTFSAMGRF